MSGLAQDSDWVALEAVRLRASGLSPSEVARRLGRPVQFVSTLTNRVVRADLAESGEPRSEVLAHYWAGAA